jgi:hypothetical protein
VTELSALVLGAAGATLLTLGADPPPPLSSWVTISISLVQTPA